jgi:hypothetical protein
MTMKKLYIEITNNEHLIEAFRNHAVDLGYTDDSDWNNTITAKSHSKFWAMANDEDTGELSLFAYAKGLSDTEGFEMLTLEEFFVLTKDDVIIKPKEIRLNVTQIKEKFGIDEDTNLILED